MDKRLSLGSAWVAGILPLGLVMAALGLAAGCGDSGGDVDAGAVVDSGSGTPDAGRPDAGRTDAGPQDAGDTDAGAPDAGPSDAGAPDAGPQDAGSSDAGPTQVFWLTLLHNSDSESALLPSATAVPDAGVYGGVAHFTTLAKDLKTEAASWQPSTVAGETATRGAMMVSAGDNFLAGITFRASLDKGKPYYETMAMEAIGYQAIGIGNHDFDFGPAILADFIDGFTTGVPFVSANLGVPSAETALYAQVTGGRLAKSTVVQLGGESIGVVGATTADLPVLSMIGQVTVAPAANAVQAEVDALTTSGIDKIVLLSHMQAVANDKLLVPMLRDVDIVVSGGGHEVLANSGAVLVPGDTAADVYPVKVRDLDNVEVPIVSAGALYKYVGRLVAKFDAAGKLVAIDATRSGPIRVASGTQTDAVIADATVKTTVADPVQAAVDAKKAVPVGRTEVALDGLRADVRSKETNEGDLVADALLWQARQLAAGAGVTSPQVALQNGGGIRNASIIPVGSLSEYDTFTILPFANRVAVVPSVTRAVFKDLLENAVSKVEAGEGRFAQVAGFRMVWDIAQPARTTAVAGSRIRSVTLDDGTKIVENGAVVGSGTLSVATIDFLANGGDGYPYGGVSFAILNATYQEALENFIVDTTSGLSGVVTATAYPEAGLGRITVPGSCGNGALDAGEECDDTNTTPGDGCSDLCKSERNITMVSATTLELLANGGTGVVRFELDDVAPQGGIRIALQSATPAAVAVPSSVIVPAGSTTAGFRLRADATAATGAAVTVTASLSTGNVTVDVDVVAAGWEPDVDELVINEVLYDPDGDANCNGLIETGAGGQVAKDEFVELVNVTSWPLDLTNVTLWDQVAWPSSVPTFAFPPRALGPGEAIVVYGGGSVGTADAGAWCAGRSADARIGDAAAVAASSPSGLALTDAGDTLYVYNEALGLTVDSVSWTGPSSASGASATSAVRTPDVGPSWDYHDAAAGHATDRHWTPGTLLTGRPFADASP